MEDIKSIFEKINKELPEQKGKIVAIDAETGMYFIGNTELDAYKEGIKKLPNKQFVFKRIGFSSAHFVGII